MNKKNQEPTRQFAEIYRLHNDKDYAEKMKMKDKSKEKIKDKEKDFGL